MAERNITRAEFLEWLAVGTTGAVASVYGLSELLRPRRRTIPSVAISPDPTISTPEKKRNLEKSEPILLPEEYVDIAHSLLKEDSFNEFMKSVGYDVGELTQVSGSEGTVGADGLLLRRYPSSHSEWKPEGSIMGGDKITWVSEAEVKNKQTGSVEKFGLVYPPTLTLRGKAGLDLDKYSPHFIVLPQGVVIVRPQFVRLSKDKEWFVTSRLERTISPIDLPIEQTVPEFANYPKAAQAYKENFFYWPTYGAIYQYFRPGHQAMDISSTYGTPIYAVADGSVEVVREQSWGLGWHLIIKHPGGFTSTYGHTSKIFVEEGQWVEKGQSIARVGTTGLATGPHLHFALEYNGTPVDPLKYLPR